MIAWQNLKKISEFQVEIRPCGADCTLRCGLHESNHELQVALVSLGHLITATFHPQIHESVSLV